MNAFVGLPAATLTTLQTKYIEAITAIAEGAQSYSISGSRTITRANLADATETLAQINYALDNANGTLVRRTFADFSSR